MDENPLYRLWLLAVSECGLIEFARNFGGDSTLHGGDASNHIATFR